MRKTPGRIPLSHRTVFSTVPPSGASLTTVIVKRNAEIKENITEKIADVREPVLRRPMQSPVFRDPRSTEIVVLLRFKRTAREKLGSYRGEGPHIPAYYVFEEYKCHGYRYEKR